MDEASLSTIGLGTRDSMIRAITAGTNTADEVRNVCRHMLVRAVSNLSDASAAADACVGDIVQGSIAGNLFIHRSVFRGLIRGLVVGAREVNADVPAVASQAVRAIAGGVVCHPGFQKECLDCCVASVLEEVSEMDEAARRKTRRLMSEGHPSVAEAVEAIGRKKFEG